MLWSLILLLPLLHIWYRMMKLPFFSKYPTSRISSLYVFPLLWLRELFFQPHFALGYCEGIVSRSSGLDVKFLGRLKKPVMTKRASLGASSVSGLNAKSDGKSSTPSSMTGTEPPSPASCYQPFPQRCDSQEWRPSSSPRRTSSSVSPSRTLERRGPDCIHRILLHKIVIA